MSDCENEGATEEMPCSKGAFAEPNQIINYRPWRRTGYMENRNEKTLAALIDLLIASFPREQENAIIPQNNFATSSQDTCTRADMRDAVSWLAPCF